MKKLKVSVITTYYNDENTILFALESINAQILPDDITVEYVVVNDCSTDKSKEYVDKYIESRKNANPNLKFKHVKPKQNLGCGGARKFGISKATGDLYMFLDADDYYMNKNFIYKAVTAIMEDNADIVEFGIRYNDIDGKQRYLCAPEKMVITDTTNALKTLFTNGLIRFNVWSKIYKKEIVKSHTYSDTRTYEDIRTIPYWVQNAKKIVIMPSVEINYRANEKSIIRANGVETRLGTIKALSELMNDMPKDLWWDIYDRAMYDLTAILDGHNSNDPGFNEMSRYNTDMLKKILPNIYSQITYNIEENNN